MGELGEQIKMLSKPNIVKSSKYLACSAVGGRMGDAKRPNDGGGDRVEKQRDGEENKKTKTRKIIDAKRKR